MNILFFLEPWIELNSPNFRFGCLRDRYIKVAKGLKKYNSNLNIKIIAGDYIVAKAYKENIDFSDLDIYTINEKSLKEIFPNYLDSQLAWYNETYTKNQLNSMQKIVLEKIGKDFIPNVIISWESPCSFLKNLYPKALIISQMPGIFSRAPFIDSVTMDFGLFKDSFIAKYGQELKEVTLKKQELARLDKFRKTYTRILTHYNPWINIFEKERKKFKKLVLLPLQVTNYFNFRNSCKFNTQFEYLTYVLDNIDPSIGVVVTQYNSGDIKDPAILKSNINFLREKYPNFIFFEDFDKFHSISQFILSCIDAVVTLTSAVGLQAMLWNKPFFSINSPYLDGLAEGNNIKQLNKFLLENKEHKNLDGALYHILTKTQILAENIFDGEWFYNYIKFYTEQLQKKELNFKFYKDINNNDEYFDALCKARTDVMLRDSVKSGFDLMQVHKEKFPFGLIEKIRNRKYQVISFDIFDTLICRPFTKTSDIFRFIEPEVKKILKITYFDFLDVRAKSECEARDLHKEKFGYEDINFDEIYEVFQQKTGATKKQIEAIKKLEKDTEMRFVRRREAICKAFDEARSLGKKVILISDMYLEEEFLRKLLTTNGIIGYDKLYVSSEVRLKKHHGTIYPYIFKDLNVEASSMLHIGDNLIADIEKAKKYGMDQYHTPKAIDLFTNNVVNKDIWRNTVLKHLDLSSSIYLGLVANKMFDNPDVVFNKNTLFNGNAYNMGYYGVGVMMFSFAQWIIEEAIRDKIDTLYFLARDGLIVKKVYDIVALGYQNAPKSEYLYVSRAALSVPSLQTFEDIKSVLYHKVKDISIKDLLLYRYGLDIAEIDDEILKQYNLHNINQKLILQIEGPKIESFLFHIKNIILTNAKKEKNIVLEYLKSKGTLERNKKKCVVDIGYSGSMQQSIIEITGLDFGGYYFLTKNDAHKIYEQGHIIKGYIGNFINQSYENYKFKNSIPLLEILFSNEEGSVMKFIKAKNDIIPILQSVKGEEKRILMTQEMQSGVCDFAQDFCQVAGYAMEKIFIDSYISTKVMSEYFVKPSLMDARIFVNIVFENNYGGRRLNYIIPPLDSKFSDQLLATAGWKEGAKIIFEHHNKQIKEIKTVKPDNFESSTKIIVNKNTLKKKVVGIFIKKFTSERKYYKYLKDPYAFFYDSQNKIVKKLSKFFK